jgi:hypothetical protein
LTLQTSIGAVDLLGEVPGVDALIAAKRTANRPKDQPGLLELEALKQARALQQAEDEGPEPP